MENGVPWNRRHRYALLLTSVLVLVCAFMLFLFSPVIVLKGPLPVGTFTPEIIAAYVLGLLSCAGALLCFGSVGVRLAYAGFAYPTGSFVPVCPASGQLLSQQLLAAREMYVPPPQANNGQMDKQMEANRELLEQYPPPDLCYWQYNAANQAPVYSNLQPHSATAMRAPAPTTMRDQTSPLSPSIAKVRTPPTRPRRMHHSPAMWNIPRLSPALHRRMPAVLVEADSGAAEDSSSAPLSTPQRRQSPPVQGLGLPPAG